MFMMIALILTETMVELMGAVGGGRGGRGGRGRKKGGKKALKQDAEVIFGDGGLLCQYSCIICMSVCVVCLPTP